MKVLLFALAMILALQSSAQNVRVMTAKMNELEKKGKRLYALEIASWKGTDEFLAEHSKTIPPGLDAYFSYVDEDEIKCVFFNKDEIPSAIATFTFNQEHTMSGKTLDKTPLTPLELEYAKMSRAIRSLTSNDTFFKKYNSTDFNFIPIIEGDKKLVYILTGPKEPGVILFGNDYCVELDKNNQITAKKKLHNALFVLRVDNEEYITQFVNKHEPPGYDNLSSVHIHHEGDNEFITETDICTLMLYARSDIWRRHTAISRNYASEWDCKEKKLVILKTK